MFYKLLHPFKLNFVWQESEQNFKKYELLKNPGIEEIDCTVDCPNQLDLIKLPLDVQIFGDIAPTKPNCIKAPLKLEAVISIQYRI